jgi:hypothetical protein
MGMALEDMLSWALHTPDLSKGNVLIHARTPERKGNLVEAITWNTGEHRPELHLLPRDHIIPTWDQGFYEIRDLQKICQNEPRLHELGVRIIRVPYARSTMNIEDEPEADQEFLRREQRYVLWAIGPKEMKDILPWPFIRGSKNDQRNSPTRMARLRLGLYRHSAEDKIKIMNMFLAEKKIALDSEWTNAPTYDELAMVTYMIDDSTMRSGAFITIPHPEMTLAVPTSRGTFDTALHYEPELLSLGTALSDLSSRERPLWYVGQNLGTYDLAKIRKSTGYKPGIGLKKKTTKQGTTWIEIPAIPRNKGGGFYMRFDVSGAFVVDYAPLFQKFASLPNNKLETIARYWLNEEYTKLTHTSTDEFMLSPQQDPYANLERMMQKAKTLKTTSTQEALSTFNDTIIYATQDTQLHMLIGTTPVDGITLLEDIEWGHMLLECYPSQICATSKKRQSLDFWTGRVFDNLHTYGDRQMPFADKKWESFSYEQQGLSDITFPHICRGTGSGTLIQPTPYHHGLMPIIEGYDFAKAFLHHLQGTSPKHRDMLIQMLDMFLMKPAYDLAHITENERTDWFFGKIYGFKLVEWPDRGNIRACQEGLDSSRQALQELIRKEQVINHSDKYILLRGDVDIPALEETGIAYKRGEGRYISHSRGSFAIAINDNPNETIVQGIDFYGRKGYKTLLEQKAISALYNAFFKGQGLEQCSDIVQQARDALNHTDDPNIREHLLFSRNKAPRDFHDYRATAHNQRRIQVLIREGILQGETYPYGYGITPDGENYEYDAETFLLSETRVATDWYLNKFFGPHGRRGRNSAEGSLSQILLAIRQPHQTTLNLT